MPILSLIIIASLFVSAISFVGGFVLTEKRSQSSQIISSLVSFAAGVMLTAALLDVFPEALEKAGITVTTPVFLGVLSFFFLERLYTVQIFAGFLFRSCAIFLLRMLRTFLR